MGRHLGLIQGIVKVSLVECKAGFRLQRQILESPQKAPSNGVLSFK